MDKFFSALLFTAISTGGMMLLINPNWPILENFEAGTWIITTGLFCVGVFAYCVLGKRARNSLSRGSMIAGLIFIVAAVFGPEQPYVPQQTNQAQSVDQSTISAEKDTRKPFNPIKAIISFIPITAGVIVAFFGDAPAWQTALFGFLLLTFGCFIFWYERRGSQLAGNDGEKLAMKSPDEILNIKLSILEKKLSEGEISKRKYNSWVQKYKDKYRE